MNYYGYMSGKSSTARDESISDVDIEAHNRRFHKGKMPEPGHCMYLDEHSDKENTASPSDAVLAEEDVNDPNASTEKRDKHDFAMTPKDCEKMVRRAFAIADIRGYGKYKTPEEWFAGEGPRGVAMIVDNYRDLYKQYVEPMSDDIDSIEDVLESYRRGTLVGPRTHFDVKNENGDVRRVDTSNTGKVEDPRFYSSSKPLATKEDWELACRPLRGEDRKDIEKARAKVLFHAHRKGACEDFGITQKEMNAKLRAWSAYPVSAMRLSNSLNAGVGEGAVWSGIENMSGLSQYMAMKEDVSSLVKSIEGDPNQFQRDYVSRTMLAIDTHTDFSDLKFEFTYESISTPGHKSCNGVYRPESRTITCKPYAPHTVAHEMGHYLDDKWARDFGYDHFLSDNPREMRAPAHRNNDPDVNAFIDHYNSFISSLDEVADESSGYTLDKKEIFARFVSRFVQWTEVKARGANRCFRDENYFNDRFSERHYAEFVKILQEKAAIDAKKMKKA